MVRFKALRSSILTLGAFVGSSLSVHAAEVVSAKSLAAAPKNQTSTASIAVVQQTGTELPPAAESLPNFYVMLSKPLVASGLRNGVNETSPVEDCILGTWVTGCAHTSAQTDVRLIPNGKSAVLEVVFSGMAHSDTVGRNGPATIFSNGVTQLYGTKRAILNDRSFSTSPAISSAQTSTSIAGVNVNHRGLFQGLVQNVATKRVYQSKPQAEAIAARNAERRLNQRLDDEMNRAIALANQDFQKDFLQRLKQRGFAPKTLLFNTTREQLLVRALQAQGQQLGAPTGPIRLSAPSDLSMFVHESLLENTATTALAGQTFTDEDVRSRFIEWLGEVPPELAPNEDEEPWSITFAEEQPITTKFSRGIIEITIRGDFFTSGDREIPAMDITARYAFENQDTRIRAIRQGEIEIYPAGFDPNGDQALSARQLSLRRLLERRFNRIFQEEIVGEGLQLPGRWKRMGTLDAVAAEAHSGWLALAWSQPQPKAKAKTRTVAHK